MATQSKPCWHSTLCKGTGAPQLISAWSHTVCNRVTKVAGGCFLWRRMGVSNIVGSRPKRGTSAGVEGSLSASEPGGTCLIASLSCAATSSSSPGSQNLCSFHSPARRTRRKFTTGSTMRTGDLAHQRLAPGGPAHPSRPRLERTTASSSIE